MDVDGWDLDSFGRVLRTTRPALAYLIPDFQNPTGNLMPNSQREELAALLRRSGTVPVVDESHQALALDGRRMPRPFAAFAPETVTLGSTSKCFWGGMRVGWVRCPDGVLERLMEARVALDLGSAVLEQLVAARLLDRRDELAAELRARHGAQRDALAAALHAALPDWRFRLPRGGLALWCELPVTDRVRGGAVALVAEGERRGVVVSPGPVFAVDGGLDSFIRLPYSRPPEELDLAVDRLAQAWATVGDRRSGSAPPTPRRTRVMVA
jgi:DNA-binding transcriptional MocR family regulator